MIYGNAAVMGISPAEVGQMSLAQWLAVCAGWEAAHGGSDEPEPMTAADYYRVTGKRRPDGHR